MPQEPFHKFPQKPKQQDRTWKASDLQLWATVNELCSTLGYSRLLFCHLAFERVQVSEPCGQPLSVTYASAYSKTQPRTSSEGPAIFLDLKGLVGCSWGGVGF